MSKSNQGWIKLHRKIIDNWIWEDPEKLRAWIDILLMVNHEEKQIPFNGHVINIERGQKLTSITKLADRWKWSRNMTWRFIRTLIEAGMVTAIRTRSGTLLTVVNYDVYQGQQNANRTKNRTQIEHGRSTNKNGKNDKEYIRTRARGREKLKPPERTYDMDELEKKLLSTN